MKLQGCAFVVALAVCPFAARAADDADPPRTVEEIRDGFDPRAEPLETEIVREWEDDGIVYRYVTFRVGEFLGEPARVAAFYGFPEGAVGLPGLLHLHGGGQRAFLHEVEFYARRGYACLSINWGGREMERAEPGDQNTDWGAVDPTQQNVPGYFNLKPGEKCLDPVESPRNNNWYLLTLAGRRGLTFLERQPEVDPQRLGVYGHSMGGNLTVYVAGTDDRVKVAAPSVGGSGFRTYDWPLLPEHPPRRPNGDVELFRATIGFQSYATHIKAPLLWLGATNDFHGIMDDTYRTGALIPHDNVRYVFTPHMNHRFTPEFAAARPLWIDHYLKGGVALPETPESRLVLETGDGVPRFEVVPATSLPIESVQIFYSVDPDRQARYWRSAEATDDDGKWSAALPILSTEQPLFGFANVAYQIESTASAPFAQRTDRVAISSPLHTATPDELRAAGVKATDLTEALIDDFTHGWRDWYRIAAGNPHHWEYSTRKISDPKWRGGPNQSLVLELQVDEANELIVVLTEHFFRPYRGPQREFAAVVPLAGGEDAQIVTLETSDFKAIDGERLSGWDEIDLLSLRPYFEKDEWLVGSKQWTGGQPRFRKLLWQTGDH